MMSVQGGESLLII
uniref:Uncharacterized protein n=2 Tax=unclassified bacterial viruses TaxID=12333 RepID=Q8HA05_9VIRU|nr:hypothetical protein [Enterobacteria phage Lahn1]